MKFFSTMHLSYVNEFGAAIKTFVSIHEFQAWEKK